MNDELRERLDRLEALLKIIVDALTDGQDDADLPELSLDGKTLPGDRDPWAPL